MNTRLILKSLMYCFVSLSFFATKSGESPAPSSPILARYQVSGSPTLLSSPRFTQFTEVARTRSASPKLDQVTTLFGNMCGGKSQKHLQIISESLKKPNPPVIAAFTHIKAHGGLPQIVSRSPNVQPYPAIPVSSAKELRKKVKAIALVYPDKVIEVHVDEGQFFDINEVPNLTTVIEKLHSYPNIKFYVGGLNKTFAGEPFNCMPDIMEMSGKLIACFARCQVCSKEGSEENQRLVNGQPARLADPLIIPEGSQMQVAYEPRCNGCWQKPQ